MGTNKRPRDLANSVDVAALQALITSLTLIVDDAAFTTGDIKKLLLNTLLSSGVVANDTDINYRALTPKGFMDSVATDARKGISQLANAAAVESKAGNTVLTAALIDDLIQEVFRESIHVTMDNIADWVGAGANVTITDIDLYISIKPNKVLINGYIAITGNILRVEIPFNWIRPICDQAVAGTFHQSYTAKPLGAFFSNSPSTRLLCSLASGNVNGSGVIILGGEYKPFIS